MDWQPDVTGGQPINISTTLDIHEHSPMSASEQSLMTMLPTQGDGPLNTVMSNVRFRLMSLSERVSGNMSASERRQAIMERRPSLVEGGPLSDEGLLSEGVTNVTERVEEVRGTDSESSESENSKNTNQVDETESMSTAAERVFEDKQW